jgi:hypothetical protein
VEGTRTTPPGASPALPVKPGGKGSKSSTPKVSKPISKAAAAKAAAKSQGQAEAQANRLKASPPMGNQ